MGDEFLYGETTICDAERLRQAVPVYVPEECRCEALLHIARGQYEQARSLIGQGIAAAVRENLLDRETAEYEFVMLCIDADRYLPIVSGSVTTSSNTFIPQMKGH